MVGFGCTCAVLWRGSGSDPESRPRERQATGRPIRLVLYVKGFPATETGGPVGVAYNLVQEFLHDASVRVTLIVQTDSEEAEIRKVFGDPAGLNVIRLRYFPSMDDLRSLPRVVNAFRAADVVHFNEFPLRQAGYVVLARAMGLPTVFSLHGLLSEEARTFLGAHYPLRLQSGDRQAEVRAPRALVSLLVRLYRWLAPHWTAVVGNSEAHVARAVELENFDPSRIRVIPHGVDLPGRPPAPAAIHGGPPRLLFVGKLERTKGPDLLLDALDVLARDGVSVDLSIVGGGSLETDLRYRVRRSKGHRVTFYGSIPHEAVLPLYEWSDIVVVPSRYEAFGLVVLEAMAAGRPVVATSVGGIPTIITPRRNGSLVHPDAESIARGIRELIENPDLRAEMAKTNIADAARYSWAAIAPRYIAMYEDVARARAAR